MLKESHHQPTKKYVKDIAVELKNIRCYNNILNKDIFPVFTHMCASWYIYKLLISSSDGLPNHVAITRISPTTIATKKYLDIKCQR